MLWLLLSVFLCTCLWAGYLGLRDGIFSPLVLLSAHLVLGVFVRVAFIEEGGISTPSFFKVLTTKSEFAADWIVLELTVGLCAVLAGYILARKKQLSNPPGPPMLQPHLGAGIVVAAVCWLAFLIGMAAQYGSLLQAFSFLQKRALLFGTETILLRALPNVALPGLAAALYLSRAEGRKFWAAGLVAAAICHTALLFLTGARGASVTHAVVLTVAWLAAKPGRMPRLRLGLRGAGMALIGAPLVIGVVLLGMTFRLVAQRNLSLSSAWASVSQSAPEVLSGTFNAIDLYAAARNFAQVHGLDFGAQYLGYVLRFVPRAVWPDKPLTLGLQMREFYYGDRLSGVPPTVFGEFYIAGSVFGLILGCVLFGVLLALLKRMYDRSHTNPYLASTYAFLLIQLTFGVVKSGFENSLFTILYYALGAAAVAAVGGMFTSPSRRAALSAGARLGGLEPGR